MQNTNIVTDEENVAGVGAPVALVGREAGRWLQAGGGGGRLCRTQLQLALRAAWRDQGPSRTHTQLKEGCLIFKTLCWKTKALKKPTIETIKLSLGLFIKKIPN